MFRQIFGSKLQHPEPETRVQGVEELTAPDPRLDELALSDPSDLVRKAALRKTRNPVTLATALRSTADESQARELRQMLSAVLCSPIAHNDEDEIARRTACVSALDDTDVLHEVVRQGSATTLRRHALARVVDQRVLAFVAANDPSGTLRQVALERVSEESALEEIAREARNRDKGIARTARERADSLRVQRERTAEGERLCQEIERIAASSLDTTHESAFQQLEQQYAEWQRLPGGHEPELARYQHHRRLVQDRLVARADLRRRRSALLAGLEQQLVAANAVTPGEVLPDALAEPSDSKAVWSSIADGAGADEHDRFETLVEQVEARLRLLREDAERAAHLRGLLREMKARQATTDGANAAEAGGSTASPESAVSEVDPLLAAWNAAPQPQDASLKAQLDAELQAVQATEGTAVGADATGAPPSGDGNPETGASKPRLSAAEAAAMLGQMASLLDEADAQINAGELKNAATAADAARGCSEQIGKRRDMPELAHLRERLAALAPRLGEMRAWRRWSTEQARTRLCEEVEQLIGSDERPAELAKRIRRYRETWKKMDRGEGGARKALWQRFNDACTKAYEPCRTHFAAEAEQRNANLQAKAGLLDRLEKLVGDTDWEGEVDWPALDKEYGRFRREWRELGPVNRRDNKTLTDRYERVRHSIESRLDPVRKEDLQRRRAVVARLREMSDGEDLRSAADAAKRAQAEWTPRVRAQRKTEQALWKDLRTACDRIFERLREQRDEQQGVREAALQESQRHCEAIESAARSLTALGFTDEDKTREKELLAQIDQARTAFADAGEVPRAKANVLRNRFRKACDAVDSARSARQRSRKRQGLDGLAERARLAQRLEGAVLDGNGEAAAVLAEEVASAWETLAPIRDKGLAAVTARYELALAAARGDADAQTRIRAAAADGVVREREMVCLDLEIATGIESPAEFSQERMKKQIDRLQASMTGVAADGEAAVDELMRRWFSLGPVPAEARARLDDRFERILAAAVTTTSRRPPR